jgi:hypothetical protein
MLIRTIGKIPINVSWETGSEVGMHVVIDHKDEYLIAITKSSSFIYNDLVVLCKCERKATETFIIDYFRLWLLVDSTKEKIVVNGWENYSNSREMLMRQVIGLYHAEAKQS